MRADNGEERCIAAFGSPHFDEHGFPARLLGVAMDVTGRRRAEMEREALLLQARDGQRAAEAAARTQDEFLAVLSHELRTPMGVIIGWLAMIRGGKLSAERQAIALEAIEQNARLQSQLVNDLLDVSSIVLGKLELEPGTARLDQALRNAVETAPLASRTILA